MSGLPTSVEAPRRELLLVDDQLGLPLPDVEASYWLREREVAKGTSDGDGRLVLSDEVTCDRVRFRGVCVAGSLEVRLETAGGPQRIALPGMVSLRGRIDGQIWDAPWQGQAMLVAEQGEPCLAQVHCQDDGSFELYLPIAQTGSQPQLLVMHPASEVWQRSLSIAALDVDLGRIPLKAGLQIQGELESPFPEDKRADRVWIRRQGLGTILDSGEGQIAKGKDHWFRAMRSVPFDANGHFLASGLRPGTYELTLAPPMGAGGFATRNSPGNCRSRYSSNPR
ncbi:MAG: carboxypeptidase-like regulatory domain-containing protein [Planctomycetota bacterium]